MDDNVTELAVALAAAVRARLPQADLGDLAADLAHALRKDREDDGVAGRSATLMARVSACLPARLIMERRLGLDEGGPPGPAALATMPEQGEDLPPRCARMLCRPRDTRRTAMERVRAPLKSLPLR